MGTAISVRVTGTKPGYFDATVSSVPGAEVFQGKMTPGKVKIAGTARVGETLRAVRGAWSPAPMRYSIRWFVNGKFRNDGQTYVVRGHDIGKRVTMTIIGIKPGYLNTSVDAAPSAVVKVGTFDSVTPKISGSPAVGRKLTVTVGAWSPKPASHSYQWYRGNTAIPGATGKSYLVTEAALGKTIKVKVTGKRHGVVTHARTSAPTKTIKAGAVKTAIPKVSGTRAVGQALSVTVGTWSPKPSYSFQWLRNGNPIPGATAKNYVLTAHDAGKKVTVRVTGTLRGYAKAVATSKPSSIPTQTPSVPDGGYWVGSALAPGLYVAPGGSGCEWIRMSASGAILGGEAAPGQRVAAILPNDDVFATVGCGTWRPAPMGTGGASSVPGDGVYIVGVHVRPGLYQASGGLECGWARLNNFRGIWGDVIAVGYGYDHARVTVRISAADRGFETYGCGSWTRIGS